MSRHVGIVAALVLVMIVLCTALCAQEAGPAAHYTFAEGNGTVLKDSGPNHLDGRIVNAVWEKCGNAWALRFREGAYVELGTDENLGIAGDYALAAWVKLDTDAYPVDSNWCILDFGDKWPNAGGLLRVDGSMAKVSFRTCPPAVEGPSPHSLAALKNHVFYHVVMVRSGSRGTFYIDGIKDAEFDVRDPALSRFPVTISASSQSFDGLINDVAIYRRALSREEVLDLYKQGAAAREKDASWVGRVLVKPFVYYSDGEVVAQANFAGVMPFPPGAQAYLILRREGVAAGDELRIDNVPANGRVEASLYTRGHPNGNYEVTAELRDASGQVISSAAASYCLPLQPATTPSPSERTVGKLPAPPVRLPCSVAVSKAGGMSLNIGGRRWELESSFSYPNAGYNRLSQRYGKSREAEWSVRTSGSNGKSCLISSSGKYYSLKRTAKVYPTHIYIRDTITNKTDKPIGIQIENRLRPESGGITGANMGGFGSPPNTVDQSLQRNPTIFLKTADQGVGMVALDDVFIVQSLGTLNPDSAALSTKSFALDRKASYTLEWSIYFGRSTDYYDFINQVRKDEGRSGKVSGQLVFPFDRELGRRWVPDEAYLRLRNTGYLNLGGLTHPLDDPGVTLDGIEFTEYPKEMAAIRAEAAELRKRFPGIPVMIHLAPSIYVTCKPDQVFPDSRIIGIDGKQTGHGTAAYYFTQERIDQGWRAWGYYPALDNSYGKALLHSADVMVDDLGLTGVFIDGLLYSYNGDITYNRWDGHSAEIDPKTFEIKRTYGSVFLLSQDALVAFCRKMRDKGAAVIVNNSAVTRTVGAENYIIWEKECFEEPSNHLMGTPICLANPYVNRTEDDIYQDALNKLKYGNLFFYYGDYPTNGKDMLTHPSLPGRMFPITFQEIHQGWVKGKERIVTSVSGIYGWRGDRDLHMPYKYDSRGREVPAGFLTTVSRGEVATGIQLSERESAVVEKVPVRLTSSGPVNVVFRDYGPSGMHLQLNGASRATLTVRNGAFEMKPGRDYVVGIGMTQRRMKASAEGALDIPLELNGPVEIAVGR